MLLPLEYHFPNKEVEPENLDKFLADGYFRTGNYLLRTRVLYYEKDILNTLHIRIDLANHRVPKRLQKKINRNNLIFTHTIQPFKITEEKERLYQLHRKRFSGNNSPTLSAFMYDNYNKEIFNTFEINIYHEQNLIGYCIFDVGNNSMASILGIYHPDFSKYSIGIYSMVLELEYAKTYGLKYYYPGYVAYEPSKFNYKLKISETVEFYDWFTKKWISFDRKDERIKVNDFFTEQLETAKAWLDVFHLQYEEFFYPYFYMGGMYPKSDCVKGIRHLLIHDFDIKGLYYIVEFHPEEMQMIISGITIHRYSFEEAIDFNDLYEDKKWKRVLLYLHPKIVVKNAFELYAGYIFLQGLFTQQMQQEPIPNTAFKNPNLDR
ncbi:MAG: hypothetical protein U0U67_04915 [Chitinophagales bacterium]